VGRDWSPCTGDAKPSQLTTTMEENRRDTLLCQVNGVERMGVGISLTGVIVNQTVAVNQQRSKG